MDATAPGSGSRAAPGYCCWGLELASTVVVGSILSMHQRLRLRDTLSPDMGAAANPVSWPALAFFVVVLFLLSATLMSAGSEQRVTSMLLLGNGKIKVPFPQGFQWVNPGMPDWEKHREQWSKLVSADAEAFVPSDITIANQVDVLGFPLVRSCNIRLETNGALANMPFAIFKRSLVELLQEPRFGAEVQSAVGAMPTVQSSGLRTVRTELLPIIDQSDRYMIVPARNTWAADGSVTSTVSRAVASGFIRVEGGLLLFNAYAGEHDLDWTVTTARAWAEQLAASNPFPPASSVPRASSSPWGQAVGRVIGVSLVAVLLGLLLRKTRRSTKTGSGLSSEDFES